MTYERVWKTRNINVKRLFKNVQMRGAPKDATGVVLNGTSQGASEEHVLAEVDLPSHHVDMQISHIVRAAQQNGRFKTGS